MRNITALPSDGTKAPRAEDPAEYLGLLPEPCDDEVRHGHEERQPRDVAGDDRNRPRAEEPVPEQEPHTGAEAARLLGLRSRPADLHEAGDEHEGHEERGRVDVEDVRRSDDPDQDAGEHRTEHQRDAHCRLQQCVCLAEHALVLADDLGQDRCLGDEGRRAECTHGKDQHQQQRKGEQSSGIAAGEPPR